MSISQRPPLTKKNGDWPAAPRRRDPTFVVSSDEETGQTIIAGMGELHLEIIKDRLFREFKVGAEAGRPQIAYRETVSANSEGEGKFVRQTGGSGQYGHARIKLESLELGAGIEIVDKTVGGVIPKNLSSPLRRHPRSCQQWCCLWLPSC